MRKMPLIRRLGLVSQSPGFVKRAPLYTLGGVAYSTPRQPHCVVLVGLELAQL